MTRLRRDNPVTLRSTFKKRASKRGFKGRFWFSALTLVLLSSGIAFLAKHQPVREALAATGVEKVQASVPKVMHRNCVAPQVELQQDLARIAKGFNGKVGISVSKVGCRWVAGYQVSAFFPQQSVSKLWVALTTLEAVDAGQLVLDQKLSIGAKDLTLFNQPLRSHVLEEGRITRSVGSLLSDALAHSDNTANDRLLWTVGGPAKVRTILREKGLNGIRFGPGERLLQSKTAGLHWSQELSLGRNFEQARARLPEELREAAMERYLADPIDGAQPAAIARALAKLASGELLSPQSTLVMMEILGKTHSGPRRLKAGAPEGWQVFHKTGTGQELGRLATGYNDVGLLRAPDGSEYAVVVMIAQTSEPIPVRMEMMQNVTKAVAKFHEAYSMGQTNPSRTQVDTLSARPGGRSQS